MTTLDCFGRIVDVQFEEYTDTYVPTCTDTDTCECDICKQIHMGQRDARRASPDVRIHLMRTCNDVMPDGRVRYVADHYWTGVYDALLG